MNRIICISGPCGCGKTTLADCYAHYLARRDRQRVYVIHGDDFHQGVIEPEEQDGFWAEGLPADPLRWEDILRFNWGCILETARRALGQGMDVVIDYVVEDELPLLRKLSAEAPAELYYIVLTAEAEAIAARIRGRGDPEMIERALFLKRKLEGLPENEGHLFDNTHQTAAQAAEAIDLAAFRVC